MQIRRNDEGPLPKHQKSEFREVGRIPWWVPAKSETVLGFLNSELNTQQLTTRPFQWTLSHWNWTLQEKIITILTGLCGLGRMNKGVSCCLPMLQGQWALHLKISEQIHRIKEIEWNKPSLCSLSLVVSIHWWMNAIMGPYYFLRLPLHFYNNFNC